jgi:hypothetical protein
LTGGREGSPLCVPAQQKLARRAKSQRVLVLKTHVELELPVLLQVAMTLTGSPTDAEVQRR